jgi:hypothetical protein
VIAYDLTAPAQAYVPRLYACMVCGKAKGAFENLVPRPGRRPPDPHAECRKRLAEWRARVDALRSDPEVGAAYHVASEALAAAAAIWERKLAALDLPDWFARAQRPPHDSDDD